MKFVDYDIVFQDVPNEVTLAMNISNCPNYCLGCHSKHLWEDIGTPLTNESLQPLLDKYKGEITCVCLMGGDRDPQEVVKLCQFIHSQGLKTAWYSGATTLAEVVRANLDEFDYIKIGPYNETLGSLKMPTTNQRMYLVVHPENTLQDITDKFWKKA